MRLLGAGSLRVRVIDGGGNPVNSGSVTIDGSAYPNVHRFAQITPESNGIIAFDNLTEGPYAIAASRLGLGGRASINVPNNATVETTVLLQASGTVEGRVFMPGGTTPVGLADVQLFAAGRSIGYTVTSDTDPDKGKFRFLNVPAGDFTLDVLDNRTGRVGRSAGHITTQDEIATVNVQLLVVGAVTGRVTANGQPVDHALVEINSDGSGVRGAHLSATTDPDGRYRFTGIPAGRFNINVSDAPGGQSGSATGTISGTVEPLPDTVANIALAPSQTVTGTVYRLGGTEPVPGAVVYVNGQRLATNDQGVYRLSFVPLGQVRVRAEAPSGNDRGEAAPLNGNVAGGTIIINVTLAGTGTITGLATDHSGTPLTIGTVTFTNDAWGTRVEMIAPVRADGTYQITGAFVGEFALRLTVPGNVSVGTAGGTVLAGQTTNLNIHLEDAGRLTGRVKSEDGAAFVSGADVNVTLWRQTGALFFFTHTNSEGEWSVNNVPLGSATVRVFDPATESAARSSALILSTNGQTLDFGELRLRHNKYGVVEGIVTDTFGSNPIDGATVTITAPNGIFTATTGADGRYHFEPVDVGNFTIQAIQDSSGFLDRRSGTITQDEQVVNVSLRLTARGTLTGAVTRHDGATLVAGAQVVVRQGGFFGVITVGSATTDALGRYTIELLPTGTLNIDISDPVTGDRQHVDSFLSANGETKNLDFALRGQGSVVVTVTSPAGVRIEGAQVTLTTPPPLETGASENTQFDGTATFETVLAGAFQISVHHSATNLDGSFSGVLVPGATMNVTVQLEPSGTITGRVLAPDGVTPVVGVTVRLNNHLPVITGAGGTYRFEHLQLGSYDLSVTDAFGRLRAQSNGVQVAADGEVVTRDLVMEATGSVIGRITYADDTPVHHAAVGLRVINPRLSEAYGTGVETDAAGMFRFDNVVVGNFAVDVYDPATSLRAEAAGVLNAGQTVNVDLHLEEAGSITGRVFNTDGTTPLAGINVYLSYGQHAVSGPDGAYRFDRVPLGFTGASAYDAEERLRAVAYGLELTSAGQVITRDLVFAGIGAVTGRVFNSDGTPSPNTYVSLHLFNAEVYTGGLFYALTDNDGGFRFDNVYVGSYGLYVEDNFRHVYGEASLELTQDGETVNVDLHLVSNTVNLPLIRYDANNDQFKIHADGAIREGPEHVFYGSGPFTNAGANNGGFLLDIIAGGVPERFSGSFIGSGEEDGREIAISQADLGGLAVTRKVYVPREGYFVRYLETLHNSSASPVTVSVRVQTNFRNCNYYYDGYCGIAQVITTSSGDNTLNVTDALNRDRWTVLDNHLDRDPFQFGDLPATAFAFDGAGGTEHAALAAVTSVGPQMLTYQWDSVTVQPGATISYLHFGVVQSSRAAAQASAERLTQLPPEAISGLSVEERAQIRNFAVPADGSSPLQALPPLDGNISGRVLSGDGVTTITGGQVQLTSTNPLFSRTRTINAGPNGAFAFSSHLADNGASTILPREPFTLIGKHPQINSSVTVNGDFPAGQTTLTQDLVFSGSGTVTGVVRRQNGSPITSGSVTVQNSELGIFLNIGISAVTGGYSLKGFPAGNYILTATQNHSQGIGLTGTANVTITAGQAVTADITLPPTGTITGTIYKANGTAAPSVNVYISNGQYTYYRQTITNSLGKYTLTDVPVGSYELFAIEPTTGIPSVLPVVVVPDQTVTQDLTLHGVGSVQVNVTYVGGAAAQNSTVYIKYGPDSFYRWAGPTNAQGVVTVSNVPTGPFSVYAYSPTNGNLRSSESSGNLTTNGGVEQVTVVLPPTGIVRGHVALGDGAPAANTQVRLMWTGSSQSGYSISTYTDENGDYIFNDTEVGRAFTVRAYHPNNSNVRIDVPAQIVTAAGQTLVVNVNFPPTATLRVTALRADDTPFAYAYIYITNRTENDERYTGNTDENGVLLIPDVPVGDFGVFIFDFDNYTIAGSTRGTINASDVGQTIDLTVREGKSGNVQGQVFFAGQPLPYVTVDLFEVATNRVVGYTETDQQGSYRLENMRVGQEGFRLAARPPWDYLQPVEVPGNFAVNGETVTINITLPGGKVSGRVFYANGTTPVNYPSVWATQTRANGDVKIYYGNTGEDGSYTIVGVGEGDFDVYAQAQGTPLTGKASGQLSAASALVNLDVTLPPSGKVRGTVRDAAGQPIGGSDVYLTQGEDPSQFQTWTDEQGFFQFEQIGLGNFYLQARDPATYAFGSAGGSLTNDGEIFTADINLPATTTLTGHVFRADGTTPVVNAQVYIENFSSAGSAGRYGTYAATDLSGAYTAEAVPLGLLRVTASHPDDYTQVGEAEVTITAADPAVVNVNLGNIVNLEGRRRDLVGADNFRYQFYPDGDMDGGGTTNDLLINAYNGAFNLTFQDENWRYSNRVTGSNLYTATVEDGGREYALGYDSLFGLLLKRKLFVPTAGGFARYLEILRNPTDKSITVQAGIDSWFGYFDPWDNKDTRFRVLVSPSQTNNTYAVTEFNDTCCHPLLGHVFAGPNSRWPVSDARFWNIDNQESRAFYRWNVTVAPGQTIIFMHFTAQHQPADAAGTQAQAAALVNLSDPHALEGMSETEKAQVVNFQIGSATATSGKVTVQVNYDSGSPAAGVSVYLREAAHADATREAGRTDAQGRLTINDVQAGAFTVRAYSPATSSVFVEATGTIAGGDVVPVTIALPAVGTVTGRVTSPNQQPIAQAAVEIAGANLPAMTAETDAIGNYAFVGVPVGRPFTVKVTRPDDVNIISTSSTQTIANPAGRLTVDFVMPMWTWVSGHVYGGDGQTPAAYANVEILDGATGDPLAPASQQADSEGLFVTGYLLVGQQGVRVRATRPFGSDFIGEVAATIPSDDVAIGGVDLTLPLPVVKGTVSRADGTPAPFPQVSLVQNDENGFERRFWSNGTDAEGHYVAFGLRAGAFSLDVRDQEGTQALVPGTIANINAALQLDVTLPAGATVSGAVFDAAGARVPFAEIALSSSGGIFDRYATADDQGNYTIERATPGALFVQAQHPETFAGALGFGSVAIGAVAAINVNLPATGTLSGTVFQADGATPVANATVKIENFAGAGGNGHFVVNAVTDANGRYESTAVQVGLVRVTAVDPADPVVVGTSPAAVTATTPAEVNVNLGNAFAINSTPFNLDGADGFRYDIWNDGGLNSGGTADGRLVDAYSSSHNLTVDDNWYYWNRITLASLEDGGREITTGFDSWGGLYMTRKIFVPSGGGFARFLEILSNPTDHPVTYRLGIDACTGFGDDTRIQTTPAETGNSYAVLFDNTGARPAIAEAFAGPGAATAISAVSFASRREFSYHWNVTVQPGQTVILMHFAVQREPADTAGARAQAESLVNLTDPHALEGMSEAERAQVINFQIPTQAGVRNEIRNPTATRKSDAAQPRRDSANTAVAATGGSPATKVDGQAAAVRPNRNGRQGLQKR